VAAGLVGAVLLVAGAAKIAGSTSVPGLPRWAQAVLPFVELGLGAFLLAGFFWASVAATALLVGFTAWLIGMLWRGDRRPCGCFGEAAARPVGGWSVVRNLVLLGAAVVVTAGADRPGGWAGRGLGAAAGLVLVGLERRVGGRRQAGQ
jgi:hypothetical protein